MSNQVGKFEGPGATYRIQFHGAFRFEDARAILPYLHSLGITHLYASPIFKSGEQSTHGYDVCSYQEIDPKLGGAEEFDRLTAQMKSLGMKLLLDIVPNHMRADSSNEWWRRVLENGSASPFAAFFDIDWDSDLPNVHRKVLIPILGAMYAEALESAQLQLHFSDGGLWIMYGPHRFPTHTFTYREVLKEVLRHLQADSSESLMIRQWLGDPVSSIPSNEAEVLKTHLANLSASSPQFMEALNQAIKELNGASGNPGSFDRLDSILQHQHYRLCWWRIGPEQIDYRRFFDITELVCLNTQRQDVFTASHHLLYQLVEREQVHAVRVDHPDGLWDPQQYLVRLNELWPNQPGTPPYVVVEKILTGREQLPQSWPVAGTTGYEFLNQLNGLFIRSEAKGAMTDIYKTLTDKRRELGKLLYISRLKVLRHSFPGQFQSLVEEFLTLASMTRYGRDFTLRAIRSTLTAYIAAFPVYRTYITETSSSPPPEDRRSILHAWKLARAKIPESDQVVLDFLASLHRLEFPRDFDAQAQVQTRHFLMRLQQLTAPLAAKGLEDTACYLFNRLVSLNEVGGNPAKFGVSVNEFHSANEVRFRHWPHSLVATATHDTKRGEDTRVRINVLSEMPDLWNAALVRWKQINQPAKTPLNGKYIPSPNDEYLLYQTLLGTWTADSADHLKEFRDRIIQYMLKAAKEAKESTSWTNPDSNYEAGLTGFIETVLSPIANNLFLAELPQLAHKVAFFGYLNSLAQMVIKGTCPGVPDFYQGSELWDFSLVDPDNRRPVDFQHRISLFNRVRALVSTKPREELLQTLLGEIESGAIKLFVISELLQLRSRNRLVFEEGHYLRGKAIGPSAEYVFCYARSLGEQTIIVVVPRLTCSLMHGEERLPLDTPTWSDTKVRIKGIKSGSSGSNYQDIFSHRQVIATRVQPNTLEIQISEVLKTFPVAVLSNISSTL